VYGGGVTIVRAWATFFKHSWDKIRVYNNNKKATLTKTYNNFKLDLKNLIQNILVIMFFQIEIY